jgi:hypothetical protein
LSDDLGAEVRLHVEECHLLREVGKVVVDRIVEPARVEGLGFRVWGIRIDADRKFHPKTDAPMHSWGSRIRV